MIRDKMVDWLWRIARNKLIDAYRRASRRPSVSVELMLNDLFANEDQTPEYAVLREEESSRLHAALLVLVILVGSMLLILNTARQQHTRTSQVVPGSTTPAVSQTSTPVLSEGQVIYRSEHLNLSSPAVWSPDGTRIAAVINPTTAESWDALTGKNVLKYQPDGTIATSPVVTNAVVWSPDGSTLAVAVTSGVSLFNARTAQFLRSFSPLQALEEGMPPLSATSGSALSSLLPHSGGGGIGLEDIAWSPDGKDVSAFTGNGVFIWNAQNGSLVTHLNSVVLINTVNSVRELWQPRGHLLATIQCQDAACQTTQANLWDTTTWSVVKQYPNIYTFDWSPDGSRLALGTMTGAFSTRAGISIWSIASGKQLYIFPLNDCAAARNSKYLSCVWSEKTGSGNKNNYFEQILIWVA